MDHDVRWSSWASLGKSRAQSLVAFVQRNQMADLKYFRSIRQHIQHLATISKRRLDK